MRAADSRRLDPAWMFLYDFRTKNLIESPYFKVVTDPKEATFFLFSHDISRYLDFWSQGHLDAYSGPDPIGHALGVLEEQIPQLAHYDRAPERHLFFCNHDFWRPVNLPSLFAPCSLLEKDRSNNLAVFPYGNEPTNGLFAPDLGRMPLGKTPHHDVSFIGTGAQPARVEMLRSVMQSQVLKFNLVQRQGFWGMRRDPQELTDYLMSLVMSRAVLCPRGAGLNSRRFFETISAGRVPVLISEPQVLPFEDVINYDDFVLRIPTGQAAETGSLLEGWIAQHGRERLAEMGELARAAFEEHLHIRNWPRQLHRFLSSKV